SYTDADGSFTLQGLADGRYTIDASKQGYVAARKDVVIPSAEAVTLTLDTGGTIHGRVLGVSEAELPSISVIAYGSGTPSRTTVEPDGTFTLHGIPDGRVTVGATRMGVRITQSMPKQIEVANGSAPPVDIDFSEGAKISGHVTRSGTPVQGGMVNFAPKNGPGGSSQIGADGSYEMSLSNGEYNVNVYMSSNFNYQTKYTVTGPATFDIDIHGATLHGRVTDASTSAPIAEAEVWILNNEARIRKNAVSDSEGKFAMEAVPDASYELHATLAKYSPAAQTVVVAAGNAPDVEVHLEHGQETTIRVVDAQSGAALQANAAVWDGRKQLATGASQSSDSAIHFWLQPGHYKASIYSRGYMTQFVDLPVPGPELRVALAQAGAIAITSKSGGTARLMLVGTLKPVRTARLAPGMLTNIEGLMPGRYSVELLDVDGVTVKATYPADVVAGQTVRLNID
ncbi:MAG TPA: carboxypeptidase-like regulatory domain-containing protein, partial [Thermoanaerobaculia bacterium]